MRYLTILFLLSACAPSAPPLAYPGACMGQIVGGVCNGPIIPNAPIPICHGQMVGTVCTGPIF